MFFNFLVHDQLKVEKLRILSHREIDPLGQPTVTAGCPSIRQSLLLKIYQKQKQSENNVRYWRDYGSGRVDH